MMSNKKHRITAFVLIAILICYPISEVWAAVNESQRVLYIENAEELLAFSKNCENESYSQNLDVKITEDIDLSGMEFTPVPIFDGTLDGGGHTISGFHINTKGSNMGFFRYLTESAMVFNLNINADVEPGGTQSTVGILAGMNLGVVTNCTASGSVTGDRNVGGLIGRNGETGRISISQNHAEVIGKTNVGGIAGLNEGTIIGCINDGDINNHYNNSYTNTGGIAGHSSGQIEGCENRGIIGYEHNGYNSGGISGFHSGTIIRCQNHGAVQGRKDVGGIVGQFEPDISKQEHDSKLDKLNHEMDILSDLLREFTSTLGANVDNTRDNIDVLMDSMDEAKGILKSARNEASDEIDSTIDDLDLEKQRLEDEFDNLRDNNDYLGNTVYRNIEKVLDAIEALRKGLDQAKDNADESLLEAIENIEACMSNIEMELNNIRAVIDYILSQIRGNDISNIDFSEAKEQIRQSISNILSDAITIAEEVAGSAEELAEACGKTPGYFKDLAKTLNDSASNLNRGIYIFGRDLSDNLDEMRSLLSNISDLASDQFDSSRKRVNNTADSLNQQMDDVQQRIDVITNNISSHTDSLGNVTDRITNQLDKIRDIAINGENQEFTVDDISGEWNDKWESGVIVSCSNTGDISGDYHIGGIAGIIAHEMFEDPELDLDLSDTVLGNVTAMIQATIWDADNSGNITAKNNYAGGIVGRADVGAVIDTVSMGSIETTDGNYCGGIAGSSNHIIKRSHFMGTLTGNDTMGGIAGKGKDIQGCYAMATILSDGENIGAITGRTTEEKYEKVEEGSLIERLRNNPVSTLIIDDMEENEEAPDIRGNFFLEEGIAGIDGINYVGQVEPLAYEDFIALEGLPEKFLKFGVTFMADGTVVDTYQLNYGDAFDSSLIPPCPKKDEQVGYWPEFDTSSIRRNVVVEAEYEPWLTSISTGEVQPLLLVEGYFSQRAVVKVTPYPLEDIMIPNGYGLSNAYSFYVEDAGVPAADEMRIRVKAEGESDAKILWIGEGGSQLLDCESDGSYLVVTVPGNGSFAVLNHQSYWTYILIVAGAAIVVMFIIKKRRKRHS